jgi:hypothetical protein
MRWQRMSPTVSSHKVTTSAIGIARFLLSLITSVPLDLFYVLEYGTTIPEKRSVGAKICHGLLEKIKYDLAVARTDYAVEPMR